MSSQQSLKRSYGSTNAPPPNYQGQASYSAAPVPQPALPPLPPGPPPPPPVAPNPYAAYGYGPTAAHQQFPAYGYGGAQQAGGAVYAQYPGSPYSQPNPAAAAYPAGYPPAANPYQQQQSPYPVGAYPQAYPQTALQQPQYAGVYPQAQPGYAIPPPPPPPGGQYPATAQAYPYPPAVGAVAIGPQQSPAGAPPFKRPRYEGGQLQGPPPALPPLGNNYTNSHSNGSSDRGRGGYGGDRGGDRGSDRRRGAGPSYGDGYRSPHHQSNDNYGESRSHRDYDSRNSPSGPSRGGYRGSRGDGYDREGGGSSRAPFVRSGSGPPSNAPFGPSTPMRGGSDRGGRGGRGRPLSGLPAIPGGGSVRGGRGGISAGESSRGGRSAFDSSTPKGPRDSRTSTRNTSTPSHWNSTTSSARSTRDRRNRDGGHSAAGTPSLGAERTLTDFRIAGLSISELGWEWKTETDKIKAVVAEVVARAEEEEDGKGVEEVEKADGEDDEESIANEEDMSISSPVKLLVDDAVDASEEEKVIAAPKKKLTKKQRKSEAAAAKRAADAVPSDSIAPSSSSLDPSAAVETVATNEGDQAKADAVDHVEATVRAEEKKKDGNKHGRDEEDSESGLVPDIDIVAKKVKPDNSDAVVLASVDDDSPMTEEVAPVPSSSSTPAPSSSAPSKVSSLPAKPAPYDSKSALPIPTGPRATTMPAPQAPPVDRENSRLRIYFSSPVASAAPLVVQSDKPVDIIVPPPSASTSKLSEVVAVAEVEVEAKPEVEEVSAVKEEENDEEYDDDVDGEPVVEVEEPEAVEVKEDADDDSDSEDVASSLLPAVRPTLPAPTETTESIADVSSPPPANGEDVTTEIVPTSKATIALPEPSPDRISISYARNTRRLVLDAGVVNLVKIFRAEGKIELKVAFESATIDQGTGDEENRVVDGFRVCRGILIESLDPDGDDYAVVDRETLSLAWKTEEVEEESTADHLLPPLHRLLTSDEVSKDDMKISTDAEKREITIVAFLDRLNPLTEARWVKTGDVEGWIGQLAVTNGMASKWKGKITVSDPDPPPTLQQALESWATGSTVGSQQDRTTFVSDHLSNNIDNTFEILLRLTRGDRATAHHSAQTASVGVLAANLSAPYAEHQTQISLAVLAMFRLSVETAVKAGIGKEAVEDQVKEIVRGIPYHLIFKSLDGMFREHRSKRR